MFEYSELLDAAAVSSCHEEQLSYVAAFAIGQHILFFQNGCVATAALNMYRYRKFSNNFIGGFSRNHPRKVTIFKT
jgi:hypothetical protein